MKFMMTLQGDSPVDEIDAHLAAQHTTVLGAERLGAEVATLSATGDEQPILERAGSLLRAVWLVDVESKAAAVELARSAPGDDGTLEIRWSYTPQDFGAPAEAPPPPPPPLVNPGPPPRPPVPRWCASGRAGVVGRGAPRLAKMLRMAWYVGPLAAAGTILGGHGLKPSAKGTRVRRSKIQRYVLDGPFAETKELVGGYLIVQARSLDEAVDLVRPWLRIHRTEPRVPFSAIEVRRLT